MLYASMRSASISIRRDLFDHQLNPNGKMIAAKFVAKVLILMSSNYCTDALWVRCYVRTVKDRI